MRHLKDLLYKVAIEAVQGTTDKGIHRLSFDSRKDNKKGLFVAVKGSATDGHDFIEQAIDNGAIAVVCEKFPQQTLETVSYIKVDNSKEALAFIASNFYGRPAENLKLIGITGTNGKTTVSTLLFNLFKNSGYKVGLLSTVRIRINDQSFSTRLTTPDSITINKYLAMMNEEGVEYCFMEASSHGIDQSRTSGLQFFGGVFTNLSHDHLDYHHTYDEYREVKKKFFDKLPQHAFALTNSDDKNGVYMLQNTKAKVKTYALKSDADYRAKILEQSFQGMLMAIDSQEVWTKLIGNFNAYNLLAVYATADLLGLAKDENLLRISELEAVEGRFEYLVSANEKITAIVDYSHTPDALKNVLLTINGIRTKNEKLFTVFGCGGDRDKSKRPEMGKIASSMSDVVIITSDNPRTEDPAEIIKDIEAGVEAQNTKKTLSIENRKQAIKTACQMAQAGDIILVAGKGHETYQEINGKRHHFDDREIVEEFLSELEK